MLKRILLALGVVVGFALPAGAAYPYNGKVIIRNLITDDADVYFTNEDPEDPDVVWPGLGYVGALRAFKVKHVDRFATFSYGMDWDRDGIVDNYFTVNLNGTKKYVFTWTP